MRKISMFKVLTLAALFTSFSAHANYSTAAKAGALKCTGNSIEVTINPERSVITDVARGNIVYRVTHKNSDGDSFISFQAFNSVGSQLMLTFADKGAYGNNKGDVLQYGLTSPASVSCK